MSVTPNAPPTQIPRIEKSPGIKVRTEPFDSEYLGGPVYTIFLTDPPDMVWGALSETLRRAREIGVKLVTCRAPEGDKTSEQMLLNAGFYQIETQVTLARPILPLPNANMDINVDQAREPDFDACITLGRTAFVLDRYHRDPAIDQTSADAVKASWVRNSLHGRADSCFVARDENGVNGFNLCMRRNEEAIIDLMAVDPAQRKKGIGRALIVAALDHYQESAQEVTVKTQDINDASLQLYRSLNFKVVSRNVTYHYTC